MLGMVASALFLLAVAKEPLIGVGSRPGAVPRYHGAMYVLWAGAMLGGVAAAIVILLSRGVPGDCHGALVDPGPVLGALSTALLLVGTLVELGARAQLGKDFTIGASAPEKIVGKGLYRLENPIYDALALQIFAFGIWCPPFLILGTLMQLLMSAGGVRGERAVIQAKFGRYNRGYDTPVWDMALALLAMVERALPPPR